MGRLKLQRFRASEPPDHVQVRYIRVYQGRDLHYHADTLPPISAEMLFGVSAPLVPSTTQSSSGIRSRPQEPSADHSTVASGKQPTSNVRTQHKTNRLQLSIDLFTAPLLSELSVSIPKARP